LVEVELLTVQTVVVAHQVQIQFSVQSHQQAEASVQVMVLQEEQAVTAALVAEAVVIQVIQVAQVILHQ
tara:strand:+ start:137 stop:343 length:207 start_codon:yes stop_codon:yes gene_type:complete